MEQEQKAWKFWEKGIKQFRKRALVIRHPTLDLDVLAKTPRYIRQRQEAQRRMEHQETDLSINPWATVHLDCKGRVLAAIFGDLPKDKDVNKLQRTFRSYDEYQLYLMNNGIYTYRTGLPRLTLDRFAAHTYCHLGMVNLEVAESDQRSDTRNSHRFPAQHYDTDRKLFIYKASTSPYSVRMGKNGPIKPQEALFQHHQGASSSLQAVKGEVYGEAYGTRHYFCSWHMQGHTRVCTFFIKKTWALTTDLKNRPTPSKEMLCGSVYRVESAISYEGTLDYLYKYLARMAWTTFPEEAKTHRKCYLRNALNVPEPHRFHLGHVIVYKQVVHQHRDKADTDFCVTFAHGDYSGGHLSIPQLGDEVHLYHPGQVAIFRSGSLYHGVTTWLPKGDVKENGITPGRVSHVFTTHKETMRQTEDKEPGWRFWSSGGTNAKDLASTWSDQDISKHIWDNIPAEHDWDPVLQVAGKPLTETTEDLEVEPEDW